MKLIFKTILITAVLIAVGAGSAEAHRTRLTITAGRYAISREVAPVAVSACRRVSPRTIRCAFAAVVFDGETRSPSGIATARLREGRIVVSATTSS